MRQALQRQRGSFDARQRQHAKRRGQREQHVIGLEGAVRGELELPQRRER
jgi:hypothetical protein